MFVHFEAALPQTHTEGFQVVVDGAEICPRILGRDAQGLREFGEENRGGDHLAQTGLVGDFSLVGVSRQNGSAFLDEFPELRCEHPQRGVILRRVELRCNSFHWYGGAIRWWQLLDHQWWWGVRDGSEHGVERCCHGRDFLCDARGRFINFSGLIYPKPLRR